jgi:hypothetical protein
VFWKSSGLLTTGAAVISVVTIRSYPKRNYKKICRARQRLLRVSKITGTSLKGLGVGLISQCMNAEDLKPALRAASRLVVYGYIV